MDKELNKAELEFMKLTAKYIAIVVRNQIEDFHAKYIPDAEMKEFNTILRNSIYTALYAKETMTKSKRSEEYVKYHFEMIPSYWEEAELLEGLKNISHI